MDNAREAMLRITPLFYDAALDPRRWPETLGLLAAQFGASLVHMNLGRFDARNGVAVLHASYLWPPDPQAMTRYLAFDGHLDGDPRLARAMRAPNRPVMRRDLVGDDVWYASPIYREVFAPGGIDDHVGFSVFDEGSDFAAALMLARGAREPPFDAADCDRLQEYIPHFRRAGRVAMRLLAAQEAGTVLVGALDAIDVGTFVVDAKGRIRLRNAAARALITSGDLAVLDDRLFIADPAVRAEFFGTIEAAAQGDAVRRAAGPVRLPRANGGAALLATITGLNGALALAGDGSAAGRALVVVTDPTRSSETRAESLQRVFGLTAAEADVASRFAAGASLRRIAADTGRSYETVRWHLKQVMAKAGVQRQPDLVRAIKAASPPIRAG